MPAVAITDTANLFGALEFALTCSEEEDPAYHRMPTQFLSRRSF